MSCSMRFPGSPEQRTAPAPARSNSIHWPALAAFVAGLALVFGAAGQVFAQQGAIMLARAFSPLTFASPVALAQVPGEALWFAVEQGGVVRAFRDGDQAAGAALDISARIAAGGEQGLLGLAFHPQWPNPRRVFLSYTDGQGASVLSRMEVSADSMQILPATEQIILTVPQPFVNHNGGHLAFGPDGMLYWGLGDGGAGGDPLNNAQNTQTLLGSILRLDVVGAPAGTAYLIPSDNPFAASPGCGQGAGCPEIYAWGLRNPWRFSFDRQSGQLWAGDVGQAGVEEVDIVESGGNYGWRCYEGSQPYDQTGCGPAADYRFPVAEYPHAGGDCSITGGYVYRGAAMPALAGAYVFGDFCTGRIRGLFDAPGTGRAEELGGGGFLLSSFAEDAAGELYVLSYGAGVVWRLAQRGAVAPEGLLLLE